MRKSPSLLVTAVCTVLRSRLVAVTVTPGSAASLGSLTVPARLPYTACASAVLPGAMARRSTATAAASRRVDFIGPSFFRWRDGPSAFRRRCGGIGGNTLEADTTPCAIGRQTLFVEVAWQRGRRRFS